MSNRRKRDKQAKRKKKAALAQKDATIVAGRQGARDMGTRLAISLLSAVVHGAAEAGFDDLFDDWQQ